MISGLDAGDYDNWSIDLSGCSGTDAIVITLTDPSIPTAPDSGADSIYCEGDNIDDLFAVAGLGGVLNWYSDPGLTTTIGSGPTYTPSSTVGTTIYYVAETASGCVGMASSITITIEPCPTEESIPNVFTPNGDGINDVLIFTRTNATSFSGSIFNRWGELIYTWFQESSGWDGRNLSGEFAPDGVYFYTFTVVTLNDEVIEYSGSVLLQR